MSAEVCVGFMVLAREAAAAEATASANTWLSIILT